MAADEAAIDGLYQLPFGEFTAARNAKSAKTPALKALEKPSLAAWAVNQVFWRDRTSYDALLRALEQLRAAHGKLLARKTADVRTAEQEHRTALRAAVDSARQHLLAGGLTATDATMHAVQETFDALPGDDRPGRLIQALKPRGFDALAGFTVATPASRPAPALRIVSRSPAPAVSAAPTAHDDKQARARAREQAREEERAQRERAREEREKKERQRRANEALQAAEAAMLRAEADVKDAERALARARTARDEAVEAYQLARAEARQN